MTNRDKLLNDLDNKELAQQFIRYDPYYNYWLVYINEFMNRSFNASDWELYEVINEVTEWLGEEC